MATTSRISQPSIHDTQLIIDAALAEDIGAGDITSQLLVDENARGEFVFVNREPLVACGLWVGAKVFQTLDGAVLCDIRVEDGEQVEPGSILMRVQGNAQKLLAAERTALNLVQRLCSVSTLAARYVKLVEGTKAIILDTRKTMPGLRVMDKYAVRAGGATNHRMRLDDAILIKDNHIAMCGSVMEAVRRAKAGSSLPVEVECDTMAQVSEAIAARADRLLLDNMSLAQLSEVVAFVDGRVKLEASGNVNEQTVRAIAATGVDYISVGRLTHSVPAVDIGLDKYILGE